MLRFHEDRRAAATIALFPVPDPTPYGLVETGEAGRVLRFIEKPDPGRVTTNTINAGIYLLERELLGRIPEGRMVSIERRSRSFATMGRTIRASTRLPTRLPLLRGRGRARACLRG